MCASIPPPHDLPGPARRPYFLPCLVAGLLSGVATIMTAGWLDETLPSRRRPGAADGFTAGASSAARYQQVPAAEDRGAAGLAASGNRGGHGEVELGGLPPLSPTSSGEWQGDEGGGTGGKAKQAPFSGKSGGRGDARLRAFRGDSARTSVSSPGAPAPISGQLGPGAGGGFGALGSSSSLSPLSSLEGVESEEEEELELGLRGADKERDALLAAQPGQAAGRAAAEPPAPSDAAAPEPQPWHKLKPVRTSLCGYGELGPLVWAA